MRRPPAIAGHASRLGGEVHGDYISCPGPGHTLLDRSLSVRFTSDDSFTVHSFAGDDWQICADHVRALCGLPQWENREERTTQKAFAPQERRNRALEEKSSIQIAQRLWRDATDPRGTLAETYLRARGLFLPDDMAARVVRFHTRCPFRKDGERVFLPAMLCRYAPIAFDYEPEAEPTAIHRTALKPDGSGHCGKQMLGPVRGQCVKLSHDEDVMLGLFVGEGIETTLSMLIKGFSPAWAATTAGIMRTFPVLGGVESLTLLADNDANSTGFSAASEAAERWRQAGREACIVLAEHLGSDFADYI